LFSTSGALLATFTDPNPQIDDEFGRSIVALGSDRVLIGAPYDRTQSDFSGVAYLFSTNGTLLTTFTNPTPANDENFGFALAALGSDRVVIGAPYDSLSAYLFSTNGTLLATFTNPVSGGFEDNYGFSVATVGNDRVLIGALSAGSSGGAAYLFNTNGTLLTSFSRPGPAAIAWFGYFVTAFGNDRVLIGAPAETVGVGYAGKAYLFSTNGTLLATFTNPAPAYYDFFGLSMAAAGSDRVLIGAPYADVAYLFDTNGTLLTTITSPTSGRGDHFGWSVARLGTDRAIIGAYLDDTGATNAGAAYLFSLESFAPRLSVTHSGGNAIVSWPRTATGFVVDESGVFASSPATNPWSQVPIATYQTNATSIFITLPSPTGNKFFRLRKP
jgi:hypothetical protein